MPKHKPQPEQEIQKMSMAEHVLMSAKRAVEEGTNKHGDTFKSFQMIAELWTVYLRHIYDQRGGLELIPTDVAEMMSLLKKVRNLYGDSIDNYVDDLGYTSLAAMLDPEMVGDQE